MKNLKINIAALTMLLGVTSALAFNVPAKKQFVKQIYGRDASGNWTLVGSRTEGSNPGQFTCEASENVCRALFNSQPAQNAQPAAGDIVEDNGEYAVNP